MTKPLYPEPRADTPDDFAVVRDFLDEMEQQVWEGSHEGLNRASDALDRIRARLAQAEAERDAEFTTRMAQDRRFHEMEHRLASLEAAGRDVLREGYGSTPEAVAAWNRLRAALAESEATPNTTLTPFMWRESEATPNTDPRGTWVHRNHGSSWEVPSVHENVTVVPAPTDEHGGRCPTCYDEMRHYCPDPWHREDR